MKLVVGLGNIGDEFRNTRHNAGFMVIENLVKNFSDEVWVDFRRFQSLIVSYKSEIIFAKPETMMNESGIAVKKICDFFKIRPGDLWVIHDDLDLRLGEYKIVEGSGPKDHNGLNSIYDKLGTRDFWHIRVGIDNRDPANRISGEDYVLKQFYELELENIKVLVKNLVLELVEKLKG